MAVDAARGRRRQTMTTISRTATATEIAAIASRAVNSITRDLVGVCLSHEQADEMGDEAIDWLRRRLGYTVRETAAGVEIAR